jgi:hypothetical protein
VAGFGGVFEMLFSHDLLQVQCFDAIIIGYVP